MRCYSCFKEIDKEGYCNRCIKLLWNNDKRVSYKLDFDKAQYSQIKLDYTKKISISGVQDKISLILEDGVLKPAERNGMYILKPVPVIDIPKYRDDIPANENLTMQIAKQIFNINTALNALIFFKSGEPAYITKRFDRIGDKKIAQEDFCQLSNRSPDTHGKNYKYDSSYEETGIILKKYCPSYKIEVEKLFRIILFNYLTGNGDAHLKNFSLYQTEFGDYILTPFYDLLSTTIHFPNETWFALDLFDNGFYTNSFEKNGFYTGNDFLYLAKIFGIKPERSKMFIHEFIINEENILNMIDNSFLSIEAKTSYKDVVINRIKTLTYSN